MTLLPEPVDVFRKVNGYENTPGIFYLFEAMTTNGTVGIISVRGTSSKMEMLVDCQLWLAAFLIQLLRFGLPFGALFTPILPCTCVIMHIILFHNRHLLSKSNQTFFYTNSLRFLFLCKTSHVRYKLCHPRLVSKSKHKSLSSHNSVSRESFQYFNIIFCFANFSFLVFVKFIPQYLINIVVVGSHVFLGL